VADEVSEHSPYSQLVRSRVLYRRKRLFSVVGLMLLLAIVIGISTSLGTANVPLSTVWRLLLSWIPGVHTDHGISDTLHTIVLDIRLPRILLAGLVGAALATAGATYQGVFRNPLADPYVIGVAQGAGLGAVIAFMLPFSVHLSGLSLVPLMAFGFGLVSAGIVYGLSRVGKTLPRTAVILAGVAVGQLLSAITSFLLVNSDNLHGILIWLLGSFSTSSWDEVHVLFPYLCAGLIVIYIYSRPLNLMQLDEEQAQQLGVNVERVKLILLLSATLITAAAVSFAGSIGFVGLIIPHAVRLAWGGDHRFLLPLSTLSGAIFLILADTLARTVISPAELPVGVVTALCGAPFFLYLLWKKKSEVF
jgi:iron complex transport system permease protein